MKERVYDFAILGAGVSGLVLAWELLRSYKKPCSILLIDGARDDDVLRTLSFWSTKTTALDSLVRHQYRSMRLHTFEEEPVPVQLEEQEYRTLFFADLQREVKAALASSTEHTIIEGRAGTLESANEHVVIPVGEQRFCARWVFDSRFRLSELRVAPEYHDERQHFRGWVLRTATPRFANFVPHFMDFRSALNKGRAFFYVLPFSDDTALVELVTLDAVDPVPELQRYVREQLGIDQFETIDSEAGVSPMTEQPFERKLAPRVRAIGILGGRAKASTGYALTRILEDTEAILHSLHTHDHPFALARERGIFRWMDGVLLEVWAQQPSVLPGVFRAMFLRNRADDVLHFLDERSSFAAIVRLALTLPIPIFVGAAVRWMWRRWVQRRPPQLPPPSTARG